MKTTNSKNAIGMGMHCYLSSLAKVFGLLLLLLSIQSCKDDPQQRLSFSDGKLCLSNQGKVQNCLSTHQQVLGIRFDGSSFAFRKLGNLKKAPKLGKGSGKIQQMKLNDLRLNLYKDGRIMVLVGIEKQVASYQLGKGEGLILHGTSPQLIGMYRPTIIELGAEPPTLRVEDDLLTFQTTGCPPVEGIVKAVISGNDEANPNILDGCVWQDDGGIGTMVVIDLDIDPEDIFFQPPNPYDELFQTFEKAGPLPQTRINGDCYDDIDPDCNEEPDFETDESWKRLCAFPAELVDFAITDDDHFGIYFEGNLVISLDHFATEVGIDTVPNPDGSGNLLVFYYNGENDSYSMEDNLPCL